MNPRFQFWNQLCDPHYNAANSIGSMHGSSQLLNQDQDGFRQKNSLSRRGPSHTGPYKLACSNCFKAKSKCVALPGANDNACQRCHRLGKQCQPSNTMRQRSITKKSDKSTSRISELEKKVVGLLSQLQSYDGRHLSGFTSESAAEEHILLSIEVDSDMSEESNAGARGKNGNIEKGPHVEACLNKFRSEMLPNFPFMHLPAHITADVLESESPIMLRTILFITTNTPENISQSSDLKRLLSESLLNFDARQTALKSLDILLALLIYLAWGFEHTLFERSMSRLMAQAVTLAAEILQPNHPESGNSIDSAAQLLGHHLQQDAAGIRVQRESFLNRRRAILGCYVLNSTVAIYFGCTNTFQWNRQMEESLAAIRVNRDCPSDGDFTVLVRLQLLSEKALQIKKLHEQDYQDFVSESTTPTPAAAMSLVSLRNELAGIRTTLPTHLTQNKLAMAHMHSAESKLSEMEYAVSSRVPVVISQFRQMMTSRAAGESIVDGTSKTKTAGGDQRIRLWQSLQSSTDCVKQFLTIDPERVCYISFLQWSQLAQSVNSLHFLTNTIEDHGWDRKSVRAHVNLPSLLERIIERFRLAADMVEGTATGNGFIRLGQRMSELRASITAGVAQRKASEGDTEAAWERLKVNGGGRGVSPYPIARLDDTFKRTRGPFDYVFG